MARFEQAKAAVARGETWRRPLPPIDGMDIYGYLIPEDLAADDWEPVPGTLHAAPNGDLQYQAQEDQL